MTPEMFSQAKKEFIRLVDIGERERAAALKSLRRINPDLAKEVRSLLDNHFSKTIIKNDSVTLNSSSDSTSSRTGSYPFQKLSSQLLGGFLPITTAILASALLAILGWGLQSALQNRIIAAKASHLNTLADLQQGLLDQWHRAVSLKVESWVRSSDVRQAIVELVEASRDTTLDPLMLREKLLSSPAQAVIEKELNALAGIPWVSSDTPPETCQRFAIWNREGTTISDWNRRKDAMVIGKSSSPEGAAKLNRVFQPVSRTSSQTFVYLPRSMSEERITADYKMETNRPQVQVITAVKDENGIPIAALMIRDQSITDDFENAILKGRFEETGESYLMDVDGWMINEPRCLEQMKKFDVFGEYCRKSDKRYIVRVADPGGSVFDGFVPKDPLQEWPRTPAARMALNKRSGTNMDGYRDFAGRMVVGTWRWNSSLQAAIFIEQTTAEAFQTIRFVDIVNRITWGIPFLMAIGLAISSGIRAALRRGKPPSRIGAYNTVGKIGEGGLGVVYKGEHRLLGRVSAIKLLKSKSINRQVAKRFEREVRLASRLVHPNAVNIYDYGLSQEGVFYYAMEYIHGVNLMEFVAYANQIPIDRSLHILIQICGAIREAHLKGLVHRDIKPQNVMICNRGGIADVVKVLDYGLVKSFATHLSSDVTETSVLMGTPKFMAPERLETPWLADPRIDIFSIGTVGYFLLMGQTPILGMTSDGMLNLMAREESPYRELTGQKAFQEFVRLIGFCVSPDPSLRPGSVGAIIDVLQTISLTYPWQQTTAEAWWAEHESKLLEQATNQREGNIPLQTPEIINESQIERV